MMQLKSTITVLVLTLMMGAFSVQAQQRLSGTIQWNGIKPEKAVYDIGVNLPKYCDQVSISPNVLKAEAVNYSFSYAKVTAQEAKKIQSAMKLGKNPKVETYVGTANGAGYASVCFYPYVL